MPPQIDTSAAHVARVCDYWLGGKDHFAADREAGDEAIRIYPDMRSSVRANRAFLRMSVRYLTAEAGIRQFLDVGTGLPSANNTHEVAQAIAPESRIVYVDNDPIVLGHARALLTSSPEGATGYLDADARDTGKILTVAGELRRPGARRAGRGASSTVAACQRGGSDGARRVVGRSRQESMTRRNCRISAGGQGGRDVRGWAR